MGKVKVTDFTLEMIKQMCEILNVGQHSHQCLIKVERDNIVIVDIDRHAVSKNPIKQVVGDKGQKGQQVQAYTDLSFLYTSLREQRITN